MKENKEIQELKNAFDEITHIAKNMGLQFGEVCFEICPADVIYSVGAYGMPNRFSHWSFGKTFHKMKLMYDLNLTRIYELVINSSPAYAFLLEGNSLLQNKLVAAHVFAHCDFFANNRIFNNCGKYMMDNMALHGDRIRDYENKYGINKVEETLDAVIAMQEHIDSRPLRITPSTPKPQKDILKFIGENSKNLDPWQKDIIAMLREEMLYFWPQLETKIMNEGWATYWHLRIIRELDLTESETIEFAKTNAYILHPSKTQLNPYLLGLKIWESIFNNMKGGEGEKKIFEVRENETDISFIRNYLTKELVEDLDLFVFEKVGHEWKITDNKWESVRDKLITRLFNGGFPYIVVEDGDYQKNGFLYLRHCYEGIDLDIPYLEKTLPHIYRLWGKTVHIETNMDDKKTLFTFDGEKNCRKII